MSPMSPASLLLWRLSPPAMLFLRFYAQFLLMYPSSAAGRTSSPDTARSSDARAARRADVCVT